MLDLFGNTTPAPKPKRLAPIENEEDLFRNRSLSEQDAMIDGLATYLLGKLLDELNDSFKAYHNLRTIDPVRYWSQLMSPTSADEKKFRESLLNDFLFVLNKTPVFMVAMNHTGGSVEAYIDTLTLGFPGEVKFVAEYSQGGPIFSKIKNNGRLQ
jgi:hypothetical protein